MRTCYRTELEVGQRFGSWTVLYKDEEESKKRKYTMYVCQCDCGNVQSVRGSRLTNGYTTCCFKCGHIKSAKTRHLGNKYDLSGDYGIGWTSNTGKEFLFDLEDYELIKDYTWFENTTTGYVTTNTEKLRIDLHRFVMHAKNGEFVDHIHGKETILDNRKSNLRIVTKLQNNINVGMRKNNKSGVTGVRWNDSVHKWEARIGYNRKTIILGRFSDINDAIAERQKAEDKYFGEYTYRNSQKL